MQAQTYTDIVPGTISVTSIMSISVTALAGTTSISTSTEYTNGKAIDNYASVVVKSNMLWIITLTAQSANFSAQTAGASTNMPASVLSLRKDGASSYSTMSTTAKTLNTGGRGNCSYPGNSFNVDAYFNPGFSYNSGLYTIGVLYTLSSQ